MCLIKHISFHLIIIFNIFNTNQCVYQSLIQFSDSGFQFQPVNYEGQIISTFISQSDLFRSCYRLCNRNILCRIFDINAVVLNQCRLFQGDINTHGNITVSINTNARVGNVKYSTNLYMNYGQSCSSNSPESRYLLCGSNFTWTCPPNTYWNQFKSICLAQSPILGSNCQQGLSMCREDLNYTCLQFNQCGPVSLLQGTTLLNRTTIIQNSPTNGLLFPMSILVNKTSDNSIIIADYSNQQILRFYDRVFSVENVTLVARNWTGGNIFNRPYGIYIHPNEKSNLYISDNLDNCIWKIFNMQVVSPVPMVVAGIKGSSGSGLNQFNRIAGIAVDSNGNIYAADSLNYRIMLWRPNSTAGVVVAGIGTMGDDVFSLNNPRGIFLDEDNSYIYVCDSGNHRIQRFSLFGGSPNNGTTVAGGNGAGFSDKQLYEPNDIYISKKRKAMYIAEYGNNRIQRWNLGDQSAVTIAGDPGAAGGTGAKKLIAPLSAAVDDDETFLYVLDSTSRRLQRFQLV